MSFVPAFLSEDPALPGRLRGRCLALARMAQEQGVDLDPFWDSLMAKIRHNAAALDRVSPELAESFLDVHQRIIDECRRQRT